MATLRRERRERLTTFVAQRAQLARGEGSRVPTYLKVTPNLDTSGSVDCPVTSGHCSPEGSGGMSEREAGPGCAVRVAIDVYARDMCGTCT